MDSTTHLIPATTANLGPGYDCLGVALRLFNSVTLRRGGDAGGHPMVEEAAASFFRRARIPAFAFSWEIRGDVPISRGLGSSVTLRLGVLHGLNTLADNPLDRDGLFRLCAELEGHPDNAAPGEFGGFVAARADNTFLRFDVAPELKFVLLIPEREVLTSDARKLLPAQVPHGEAVCNTANACRITAAFAARDYAKLRGAFVDYLHQPYREPLLPFLTPVIEAGVAAGALGGFLSGSGSCIACVATESGEGIAAAMVAAAGVPARALVLQADNTGVQPA